MGRAATEVDAFRPYDRAARPARGARDASVRRYPLARPSRASGVRAALVAGLTWLAFCAVVLAGVDLATALRAEDASLRQAQADLKQSLVLAQAGLGQDPGPLAQARVYAAAAGSEAKAAEARISRDPIVGLLRVLPPVDRNVSAALSLNALVVEAAGLAGQGEDLMIGFQAARSAPGKPSTLDVAGVYYVQHRAPIDALAAQVLALPARVAAVKRGGIASPLRDAYTRLDRAMVPISQQQDNAHTALSVLPVLFGVDRPANYLLLFADNAELRPGGGFIGTFGVLGFNRGAYAKPVVTRVGIAEEAQEKLAAYRVGGSHYVKPPDWILTGFPDYNQFTMTLGNSAVSPNWPDDARLAERLYQSEHGGSVDGVIQVDLTAVSYIVAVTGPIDVPDGTGTVRVTADNASDLLVAGTRSKDKSLLSRFQENLTARLEKMSPANLQRVLKAAQRGSEERHLMVYMNDPVLQALVDRNHLSRPLPLPAPGGDALMPVFANVVANKTDHHVERSLKVTVHADGRHHVELNILNNNNGPELLSRYREFVRLYVPPAARQVSMRGFMPRSAVPGLDNPPAGDLGPEAGWHTYGGWLQVLGGHRFTVTWDYTLPAPGAGYRLDLVKQPGIENYPVRVDLEGAGYSSAGGEVSPGGVSWRLLLAQDTTLTAKRR